jgi:hypothetical protein
MTYRTRELAEEYANSTIVLDNSRGEAASRGAAERNWAGKEELKIKGRFRETAEEQAMLLYSFENANKTTRYETETIRRDKQRAGGIHYHASEFRQTDEHCAVMLKTAGGAAASASTTQAEPVTGKSRPIHNVLMHPHQIAPCTSTIAQHQDSLGDDGDYDYLERLTIANRAREIRKSFTLVDYRSILPARGQAACSWPPFGASLRRDQPLVAAVSFITTAATKSTNQISQDVRVRRKDAAAEIHAYILYKRILGNYAQASKRLAGLYQMKAAERKEERRLAESVRHFQAAGEYRQGKNIFGMLRLSFVMIAYVV